jgi:POT family proton-dependent oligopeptide transporter
MWERFGYYGMRALLILFLVAPVSGGGMGLDVLTAGSIYGLYTASVYLWSLPGGWLADRFLGQRRAVLYGGILIAIGYLMLAATDARVFYAGLCVVVAGTGLLKPNISTIVGQIYGPSDPRRDSAFSIFYMGINVGATIAPLICGYVGQRINWHWGFALSGIGMALGVVQYWFGQRHLGEAGLYPVPPANEEEAASQRRWLRIGVLVVAAVAAAMTALHLTGILPLTALLLVNALGVLLFVIVAVMFAWMLLGGNWTPVERKRLAAILVLFIAASLFWSAFEQAGSSLNLFATRSTDNHIFLFEFPSSWFQSLNSFFIVAVAPLLAWLWLRLGTRQPSSPAKFALGLIFVGTGYVVLMFGAMLSAGGAKVTPMFLLVTYLMHTIGELCLSPVGLSAITKLAPVRIGSLMMGVWFVSISVGNYLGGRLASVYGTLPVPVLFGLVAGFSILAGLCLFVIAKPVTRLMGGVK